MSMQLYIVWKNEHCFGETCSWKHDAKMSPSAGENEDVKICTQYSDFATNVYILFAIWSQLLQRRTVFYIYADRSVLVLKGGV